MGEIIAAIRRGDTEEQAFTLPSSFQVNTIQQNNQSNVYWNQQLAPPFIVPNQSFIPQNTTLVSPLASGVVPPAPPALSGPSVHQSYTPTAQTTVPGCTQVVPSGTAPPQAYVATVPQSPVATGGNVAHPPVTHSGVTSPIQTHLAAMNNSIPGTSQVRTPAAPQAETREVQPSVEVSRVEAVKNTM